MSGAIRNDFLFYLLGGVLAAPLGGWAVKRVSARLLMIAVGLLIVTLSIWQLLRAFKLI